MSAITVYLEDAIDQRLRQAAKSEGITVSRFVARLVAERTADTWPEDILALAGTWADEDDAAPVRRVADAPREIW